LKAFGISFEKHLHCLISIRQEIEQVKNASEASGKVIILGEESLMGNIEKAEQVLRSAKIVDVGDPWFKVVELPKDVFGIIEDGHAEEVCSFLILGKDKALLLDTGMGVSNIVPVVNQLTDLEMIVVNSHSHFDHIGDNWRFPAVHIYADEYAMNVLSVGFSHEAVIHDSAPELFTKPLPPGFEPSKYEIKPMQREKVVPLQDGDVLNLGDRRLEVIHTPGHSQDGISLLDREGRALFIGDTYCEWLFAFIGPETPGFGYSDLKAYERTMKKLASLVPDLDYIYASHVPHLADPEVLIHAAQALEDINQGRAKASEQPLYGENRRVYEFDGFMVWV
jgi:glyoxylase-like metal-dependent hydrolase (beta-lactamase superfamily II)